MGSLGRQRASALPACPGGHDPGPTAPAPPLPLAEVAQDEFSRGNPTCRAPSGSELLVLVGQALQLPRLAVAMELPADCRTHPG